MGMGNLTNRGMFNELQIPCCHLVQGPTCVRRGAFQRCLEEVLVAVWSLFVVWVVLGAFGVEWSGWSTAASL